MEIVTAEVQPEVPAESITWNIEESSLSLLPSEASNLKESTIVLDTTQAVWANVESQTESLVQKASKHVTSQSIGEAIPTLNRDAAKCAEASSSIGPSQSASQAGAHERFKHPEVKLIFSKYFSQVQAEAPAEPIVGLSQAPCTTTDSGGLFSATAKNLATDDSQQVIDFTIGTASPIPIKEVSFNSLAREYHQDPGLEQDGFEALLGSGASEVSMRFTEDSLCAMPEDYGSDFAAGDLELELGPMEGVDDLAVPEYLLGGAETSSFPAQGSFDGQSQHEDFLAEFMDLDQVEQTSEIFEQFQFDEAVPWPEDPTPYHQDAWNIEQFVESPDSVQELSEDAEYPESEPTPRRYYPEFYAAESEVNTIVSSEAGSGNLLCSAPTFLQGRSILLGLGEVWEERSAPVRLHSLSHAEADVARSIRGHWRPQRF